MADAKDDPKAAAAPVEKAPVARKAGPPKGEAVAMAPGELLGLIEAAEKVEVVFSDGTQEILAFAPILAPAPMWKITGLGLQLEGVTSELHGPAWGQPAISVAGYALFLDGDLEAYRPRADVVNIGPNMTIRLENDIIF